EMVSSGDVWALGTGAMDGNTTVEHYDGQRWSVVEAPREAGYVVRLDDIAAVTRDQVWAVGSRTKAPNGEDKSATPESEVETKPDFHSLIARWNGVSWSIMQVPDVGHLEHIAVFSEQDLWALSSQVALHWDGSTWSTFQVPTASWAEVSASAPDDIWLAGWTTRGDKVRFTPLPTTAHWDGRTWSMVPPAAIPGAPAEYAGKLDGIAAIAKNDVWAVGTRFGPPKQDPNGYSLASDDQTLVMHWGGTAWNYVPGPNLFSSQHFNDIVAVSDRELWAVGTIDPSSYGSRVLVTRFWRDPC
ncbi:MAG TPA: hypothetical protein VGE04_18470, partial [Chloroflexia bacterium]